MKEIPEHFNIWLYIGCILARYIAGSLLFIWSVNTLFACGITYSLKTVLAGSTLIWLTRLFLRGLYMPWQEEDGDVEEERLSEDERKFYEQTIAKAKKFGRKIR